LVFIEPISFTSIYQSGLAQTSQKTFSSMVKELIQMGLMFNIGKEENFGPKKLYFPLQIGNSQTAQFAPNPPQRCSQRKRFNKNFFSKLH
jgi:hypothetical protein